MIVLLSAAHQLRRAISIGNAAHQLSSLSHPPLTMSVRCFTQGSTAFKGISYGQRLRTVPVQATYLGCLCKHLLAEGALIISNSAGKDGLPISAAQVDVDGSNLCQHFLWLPPISLCVLDLQFPPFRPCKIGHHYDSQYVTGILSMQTARLPGEGGCVWVHSA